MAAVTPTEEIGPVRMGVRFANTAVSSLTRSTIQRHTPFRQTPIKRKIPTKDVTNVCLQENPEQIALLLQKQWCLYHVTPLYKFSYAMLKKYSRDLSVFFHAEKKRLAVEIGIELSSKANFSMLAGLKLTEHDPEAVFIQISSKSQVPPLKEKVVWTGWLCCVDGDLGFLESLPGEFICLPLLFVNGTETITSLVAAWFQKTFDCYISAFRISSENLCWMAAMWVNCFSGSVQRSMELEWTVPAVQLTISLTIHPEDAKALWDSIHRDKDEIAIEEVELFMSSLHSHFHRHFGVRLAATHLVKVSTAVASAHCDGKLKLFNSKHIYQVLSFLTELAFLQTQYQPNLSRNVDYLD
ncbi:centromere protein L [Callorhinchus milii]|uniref:Centromere protein L n=1 Tax=Callorhinchus milii TaxID=7868 RepID=V9KYT9_CALMI|nr:centromere protein L [Callorhinchus milii]|eukprot:gi/632969601/ref/XP_007901170.1/ PREDICTED: centromere protein L isoform X1 [Callorhinchus milii]